MGGEHGADGGDQVGGVGHLHEGVDGGGEGIALDGDEADVDLLVGLGDGDGAEGGRCGQGADQRLREDGRPAAGGDVRGEDGGRVGVDDLGGLLELDLGGARDGGAQQTEGEGGDVVPGDAAAVAGQGGGERGGEEEHAFAVEGEDVEALAGGLVEVHEGDVHLALAEQLEEAVGVGGLHRDLEGGEALGEGDGEQRGEGGGGGEHAEAEGALHAGVAEFVQLLLEAAAVVHHLLGPGEDALALAGEAFEALAALDDEDIHVLFELLDAGGEGGLGDAAGGGGAGEVLFLVECQQVLEVADDQKRLLLR